MGLLREQDAKLKKGDLLYCCKQVWMKIGGRIPWNATAICETYEIACLMGKHRSKGDLKNHLKDRSFHLVHWLLKIIQNPRKTSHESINLVSKYSLEYSSVMYCTREESGKETYRLWTLRSWKRWMHQKSMLKDSTRKRRKCLIVVKCSYSPVADGTVKPFWRRPGTENIHLHTGSFNSRKESPRFPERIRRVSTSTTFSRLISGCWWSTRWFLVHFGRLQKRLSGDFMYRHHVEPRVKLLHAKRRIISLDHWTALTSPELLTQPWM